MTNTDLPEIIGTEWIRYETLYGDLDSLSNCKEKYKTKYVVIVIHLKIDSFYTNLYFVIPDKHRRGVV